MIIYILTAGGAFIGAYGSEAQASVARDNYYMDGGTQFVVITKKVVTK